MRPPDRRTRNIKLRITNTEIFSSNSHLKFVIDLRALVRFELTTSGFVILRSNSVELQSRLDLGPADQRIADFFS
jgi:hypothetical protein